MGLTSRKELDSLPVRSGTHFPYHTAYDESSPKGELVREALLHYTTTYSKFSKAAYNI